MEGGSSRDESGPRPGNSPTGVHCRQTRVDAQSTVATSGTAAAAAGTGGRSSSAGTPYFA
jgi:hypothetical protein